MRLFPSIIRRFNSSIQRPLLAVLATATTASLSTSAAAFNNILSSRSFNYSPKFLDADDRPKLILIGGCTGTGKSTFGMSVALDQDILRCISTDTVRAVMRSFISPEISPALHRSSYTPASSRTKNGGDDPVTSWRETCTTLQKSVDGLVDDAIRRGVSLVVEGVHIVPQPDLIEKWEKSGGVAVGCLLTISDAEKHKALLYRRGEITKKGEQKKIEAFDRVRAIQEEMIRLAQASNWLLIEQKLEPDPLEMISTKLYGGTVSPESSEFPGNSRNENMWDPNQELENSEDEAEEEHGDVEDDKLMR